MGGSSHSGRGFSSLGEFHKSSEAGARSTVVRRSRSRDRKTPASGQEIAWNCGDLERSRLLLCGHSAERHAYLARNGIFGRSGELPSNILEWLCSSKMVTLKETWWPSKVHCTSSSISLHLRTKCGMASSLRNPTVSSLWGPNWKP